jgi:hypothetical protein
MAKVNFARVILGGLLAGVIINISEGILHNVVLKAHHEEVMRSLGKTMPTGGSVLVVWLLYGFAWGIVGVWLYAAIRPRYGPGPATAVRAAVTAWFFCCLLAAVAMWNLGIFPVSGLELVWNLVQDIVAVVAGAWLYKEAAA